MSRQTLGPEELKQRRKIASVREIARTALRIAYDALDSAGIRGWLTWGSVLGFHREGGFLPHDNDVDIAVPLGSITPDVISKMRSKGLELFRETKFYGEVFNRKFLYHGFGVDLYGLADQGDVYISRSRYGKVSLVYTHPKMPLVRRCFEGTDVWVLDPAEEYVRHIFGEGWSRPPPPGWHNSFSLPNLIRIEGTPMSFVDYGGRWLKWKRTAVLSRILISRGATE